MSTATGSAAPSAGEFAEETSRWLVGGGIVTMALFPLAIPILLLTVVFTAPLLLVGVVAALPVAIVAGVALAIRAAVRRVGSRGAAVEGGRRGIAVPSGR